MTYHVVINAHAGRLQHMSQDDLSSLIGTALDGKIASLTFADGNGIEAAITARLAEQPGPVLIGGGDGTIAAAARVTREHGVSLGILPLGTMNLLAQDLGLGNTVEPVLPRYAEAGTAMIDAGQADDRLFLCSAVIGIVPETAIKREEARRDNSMASWASFSATLARGLSGQTTQKLTLSRGTESFDVELAALVIGNNAFAPRPDAFHYRRASLTAGKLAVYGIKPQGVLDGARLLFKLWNGTWHEDETVFSFEIDSLTVAAAQPELLVSLDGEPLTMKSPVTFTSLPQAVPILLPGTGA